MDERLLKISEIAAFFNVSVKAIRIYEKKGILKPVMIDTVTGYRFYSAEQVQTLDALLELKALGFSLDEIKQIMTGALNSEEILEAFRQKSLVWRQAILAAENKISAIGRIVERISDSKDAARLQVLSDQERAWLLARMICVEDLHAQSSLSEALWL